MLFSCFYVLLDSNFRISVICVHVSMFVRMLKIHCKPSERDGVLRCSLCFWSIWQLAFAKMAEVMLKGSQWLSWKIGSKTKGLQTRERSRSYWSGSVAAFEDLFSHGMQLGFCYVLLVVGFSEHEWCLNREFQWAFDSLVPWKSWFPHFPCPCATHGEGRNKFPAKSQPYGWKDMGAGNRSWACE